MARYRNSLPQLDNMLFLTDGGIETTLIYQEHLDLPDFSAFVLMDSAAGVAALNAYYRRYAALARQNGNNLILETPTWRASADWGQRLGYTADALAGVNLRAVALLEAIRLEFETPASLMVISGCLGPRGDGYQPGRQMNSTEAADYHRQQLQCFADSAADMACVLTMNYAAEASGIAQAARELDMPLAVSFTVETNGCLPSGQPLFDAMAEVEDASNGWPAYYMINCAHPTHFASVLATDHPLRSRLRGLRANASRLSHAELDVATALDDGNPEELGEQLAALRTQLPQLSVLGGCCGTDHRHIQQIARRCQQALLPGH